MARVFVTGATGCLGEALVTQLLAEGHEVLAQGRSPSGLQALRSAGAQAVDLDLTAPLPPDLLRGIEVVHHAAALSSAWGPEAAFQAINVTATTRLLAMAQAAGVGRFVFASSPSIYANGAARLDLPEDAPIAKNLPSPYARSKYQAEKLVLAADRPQGMRTIALRPRAIYGRGDRSLMPRLLQAIRRGRVPMIAGGEALIDVTHRSDAALAMRLAARPGAPGGAVYNITSGQAYRFADLMARVADLMGASPRPIHLSYKTAMRIATALEAFHRLVLPAREPILTRQAVASLGHSLTLDIRRAGAELGYRPQSRLEDGILDYDL